MKQSSHHGENRLSLVIALTWVVVLGVAQFGCGSPSALTILDSESGIPIEGALVFSSGESSVHRSNVHGAVELPAGYGASGITIHAKNYQPLDVELSHATGEIHMVFDETLMNPVEAELEFSRGDSLRGTYGPYRANNDLLTYDLDIAVDVEREYIKGTNTVGFEMLDDGTRIQLDLYENMNVDSIMFRGEALTYSREFNSVFIDFPETLRNGETYSIDFHYSGFPEERGRFGSMTFSEDSLGNPWVFTACQGTGASVWWPNKDQQADEVDSMTISVTVPSGLMDISNGRLMGVDDLGDGTTKYRWKVHYPINSYNVSVNIADYTHFSDTLGNLSLDYYVLPFHLDDARRQFTQVKPMLSCFNERFGDYPFPMDGYKLVEVPYSGMEHQSAVTYGNGFGNGYQGRDWTGVGISMRFDFIIVHESTHEWFGNSITASDFSDSWIHEGWGTYAEAVYVECQWGYEDALTYVNGYKEKVGNRAPIIGPPGVYHWPTQDQYFKGALFLHTLRHVVDDDEAWWAFVREYKAHFDYQNIWTTDVINFFNDRFDRDWRPIFEQYLYYPSLPILDIRAEGDNVSYRWRTDVADFDMPIKVRFAGEVRTIYPTGEWQSESLDGGTLEDWQPATDLFYIEVAHVGDDSEST